MGWGETADALWRREVNVMVGSAVYEVLLMLMNYDDGGHRAHRHTDRQTHKSENSISASFTPFTWRI